MVPTGYKKIPEEKIIQGSRGLGDVLFCRLVQHIQEGAVDGSSMELKRKERKGGKIL